ncbi:MAG TPA: cupredoxin domain-containing protein [Symbiobacteriaceae bacterium]|nr:cupredoxin domain-containing protein [Symbiobacteriaceae bacterium]
MSKRLLALTAGLVLAVGLTACAGGRDTEQKGASLKEPIAAATATLDELVRKIETGNAAAGREAYQSFAGAFGQVLGPVSFKDSAVAQQIANANTGLQEALEQKQIDGAAVKRQAEALRNGLYAAADVMGVSLRATAGVQVGAALQPARVIEVTAREYEFSPKVIEVKKGERVTVRLRNAGTEKHEWELEALHVEIKPTNPGTTGEVTFTAPTHAGTYEYACHVDQHYEKGMRGFLRVK